MVVVKINMDTVPDELLPVSAGRHELLVVEPPEFTKSRSGKDMVVVSYVVNEEGPDKGRPMRDWFVEPSKKDSMGQTKLKRLAMSCGASWSPDEFDTDELIGKVAIAVVINAVAKDRDDPDNADLWTTRANIKDYVVGQ